jgi:hypothetical protein
VPTMLTSQPAGPSAFLLFACASCSRKGVYLVPGRPLVRCKYCRWLRHLSHDEHEAVQAGLGAVLQARDGLAQAARNADTASRDTLVMFLGGSSPPVMAVDFG